MMATLYADLSHHDWSRAKGGQFDWRRIRAATSPVVCLRATYGDPQGFNPSSYHFVDMARAARAAGFTTIGAYHNLTRGDQASINRQVDYLRREMDAVGAEFAMTDIERYPELLANGLWPRLADVQRFADRWHQIEQRVLANYLPRWVWQASMGSADLRGVRGPLVASNYGDNTPGLSPAALYAHRGGDRGDGWAAYGGVTPAVWQFGSKCNCPGASGETDVNAYRGTVDELRALLTGGVDMSAGAEAEIHTIAVEWRHMINGWNVVAGKNHPSGKDVHLVIVDTIEDTQAQAVQARTEIAGLAEVVRQALTGPTGPLSAEQFGQLLAGVREASAAAGQQVLVELAEQRAARLAAARAEAGALAQE
jgi:hypothetical protein